ncbi:class I SAM-dependent methyltransferase [Rhodovibrionaceae bacterium A322]
MQENDRVFTGSIPEIYDRYLVPLIFEDFAEDLAERVLEVHPERLLETAAGSGVVTRVLAPRLTASARYCVSDLNQPMLDQAALRQGQDPRLIWQQANALDLPFEDAGFDAVLCQFGVMFFPDRVAGYREARRVLAPGGRFFFNVWDGIEQNDFARLVTETAASFFLEDPPLFLARTPHGYHDPDLIRSELAAAGFDKIEIRDLEKTSWAASARDPALAYCQGTPLRSEIEARDASLLEAITEQAAQAIADRFGAGPVEGRIRGLVITAQA